MEDFIMKPSPHKCLLSTIHRHGPSVERRSVTVCPPSSVLEVEEGTAGQAPLPSKHCWALGHQGTHHGRDQKHSVLLVGNFLSNDFSFQIEMPESCGYSLKELKRYPRV